MRRILTLCLLAAACGPAPAPAPPATPATVAHPVEVTRVTRQDVDRTLELPGELRALREASLYPRIAGYLSEVSVDIGDVVAAGQVVALVEAPERGLETTAAEAQVGRLRSESQAAVAQLSQQGARARAAAAEARRATDQVAAARAEVAQAEADQRLQASNLRRLQGVYELDAGLVPGQDLDVASRQVAVARARLQGAREMLSAAEEHRRALQAESAASSAQIEATLAQGRAVREHLRAQQASADQAREWEGYRRMVAPFSGVVVERGLDVGALVNPTMAEPVLGIADVTRVRLRVGIPEMESAHVRRGSRVTVVADALPQETFEGRVSRVSGAVARATRTLEVEAEFANPGRRLRPGMYVRATFALETHRGVSAVPTGSLVREKKKTFVFVVDGGKAARKPVEIGFSNRRWTEISAGLEGQEQVVVQGQDKLSEGAPVEVRP